METESASADELIEEWNADVIETFTDGGRAVKIRGGYGGPDLPDNMQGGIYYVPAETPDGHHDWLQINGNYRYNERERKAEIYGRLQAETGFLQGAGNTVPVSVAVKGQKAIASYMWAVKGWNQEVIANKMGKAESTINQYITDYKAGRTA